MRFCWRISAHAPCYVVGFRGRPLRSWLCEALGPPLCPPPRHGSRGGPDRRRRRTRRLAREAHPRADRQCPEPRPLRLVLAGSRALGHPPAAADASRATRVREVLPVWTRLLRWYISPQHGGVPLLRSLKGTSTMAKNRTYTPARTPEFRAEVLSQINSENPIEMVAAKYGVTAQTIRN